MADDLAGSNKLSRSPGGALTAADQKPWDAGSLMRRTVEELQHMLDAKNVIGEPMTFGSATIVPLVSVGFGFGASGGGGGGTKASGERGDGGGSGGGAGGGVKPIAVLVIEDGTVRLDSIPGAPSGLDKLSAAVAGALERRGEKPDSKGTG